MNSNKKGSILIVGCGWVGKKLGQDLSQKGYNVYGTTRSESNFSDLENHNIKPVKLELPVADLPSLTLPEVDTVVISISPGRGGDRSEYPFAIRQLAQLWKDANVQVIMYSSSSAYGNATGVVTEESVQPDTKNENAIVAAEGELRAVLRDSVILRLSGLYGEDRHPVKYLAGRTGIKDGNAPVNLVHREDVIAATEFVIEKEIRGDIFNVCAPVHPKKKEIYTTIAARLRMEKPEFESGGEDGKEVSSEKILNTGFHFVHEDPLSYQKD